MGWSSNSYALRSDPCVSHYASMGLDLGLLGVLKCTCVCLFGSSLEGDSKSLTFSFHGIDKK